mmetsp:Transcript_48293/g.154213  ORF Transcript_48293/g.154213 Transcript_48293/m.154213 type:complete len:332 (+) Transcript_48293:1136-2131(+)
MHGALGLQRSLRHRQLAIGHSKPGEQALGPTGVRPPSGHVLRPWKPGRSPSSALSMRIIWVQVPDRSPVRGQRLWQWACGLVVHSDLQKGGLLACASELLLRESQGLSQPLSLTARGLERQLRMPRLSPGHIADLRQAGVLGGRQALSHGPECPGPLEFYVQAVPSTEPHTGPPRRPHLRLLRTKSGDFVARLFQLLRRELECGLQAPLLRTGQLKLLTRLLLCLPRLAEGHVLLGMLRHGRWWLLGAQVGETFHPHARGIARRARLWGTTCSLLAWARGARLLLSQGWRCLQTRGLPLRSCQRYSCLPILLLHALKSIISANEAPFHCIH